MEGLSLPNLTAALEQSCDIQEALCNNIVGTDVGQVLNVSQVQCAVQNVACRDLAAQAGAQFEF